MSVNTPSPNSPTRFFVDRIHPPAQVKLTAVSTNRTVQSIHQTHLETYFPVFIFSTLVEIAAMFLVHPSLFTLIVCLKTTGCLGVWMARSAKGDGFVSLLLPVWLGFLCHQLQRFTVTVLCLAGIDDDTARFEPLRNVLLDVLHLLIPGSVRSR